MKAPFRLLHVVGRKGAFLLFVALLDFLYAVSLAFPATDQKRTPALRFVAELAPLPCWGFLWGVAGVVLTVGAFRPLRNQWAFASAMSLKVLWATVNLLGWVLAGASRGWVSAIIWYAFAAFVGLIAAWPEDSRFEPSLLKRRSK